MTDGTAAGTALVEDIQPGSFDIPAISSPLGDGWVLFSADDGAHGRELWATDGTAAGTALVEDINPGGGSSIQAFTPLGGGRALFAADDGARGQELWVTDGTAAGTRIVADINGGPGGGSGPNGFTPVWPGGGDTPLGTGEASALDPFR